MMSAATCSRFAPAGQIRVAIALLAPFLLSTLELLLTAFREEDHRYVESGDRSFSAVCTGQPHFPRVEPDIARSQS